MIGHDTHDGWEDGASRDAADDETGTSLGVATETAERERENCGEDAGFEEEHEGERGDAGVALGDYGADDEDDDHGHEEPEDLAGLEEAHEEGGDEAADGEEGLCDGEEVRGCGLGGAGSNLEKEGVSAMGDRKERQ